MMQTLRRYTKHILWVVAVAFIITLIFSWGMGGFKNKMTGLEQGVVGVINGQEIKYQQFKMLVDQEMENAKTQYPDGEIPEFRLRSIRDQVWQTVVRDVLFQKEVERLNLQVSPEEIVFILQNNPPEFLRNQPDFLTDGEFDVNKYQAALSDPRNYESWIPVENYLRTMIPPQKLTQRLLSSIRITESELREAYRLENEKVTVKYLLLDPGKISMENIVISDADIQKYYKAHLDEYNEPEKRIIQYIKLEGKPSSMDTAQVHEDILQIRDLLMDGEDFETLAAENSEDATAEDGGDLGWFGRGQMVPPFEEAAFAAKVGELVGPVQTQFGEHLIKVTGRKTENGELKVRARHILLKYKTTPETYDALNDQANYIYEELERTKGKLFDQLAQEEGLQLHESPPFPSGTFIPGLGMAARINHFAFQEKLGWYSRPIGAGPDIIIFRIKEIEPGRTKTVEEVRESIVRILEREKQMEAAGEECRRLHASLPPGRPLDDFSGTDYEVRTAGPFGLNQYVNEIGKDPAFNGTSFRLALNSVSEPVKGIRGWYLIQPVDKTEMSEAGFQAVKDERRNTLLQTKVQQMYSAWFNALQEKADIENNMALFF